ncbi:MAG: DUF4352 domain-containing protein [Lachnospiraceae bacterium]
MKKRLYLAILTVILCISISGCGNNNNKDSNDENISGNNTEAPKDDENNKDNENNTDNGNNEEDKNNGDNTTKEPSSATTPSIDENQGSEVTETIEPKAGKLTAKQQYSDAYREVKFLGLKQYKSLKGDNYTDKAKKNKKFLVLFLSIRNTGNEKDYINPNYITAKVDGKDIEHTFLVNEPFNYPTIFTNIEAGSTIGGFIVWEVPKNWKKFEMEYSAWKNINGLTLTAEFTPKDLSNPLIYNASNFQ